MQRFNGALTPRLDLRMLVIAVAAALFVALPGTALSEFVCKSQIKYSWKKTGEEEEKTVVFALLETRNEEESLAKAKLEFQIVRNSARAAEHCSREHQNLSGCISAKFQSQAGVLERLGFASRKRLEEAIAEDCKARIGDCGKVEATEITCESSDPEGEEGEKKDKKDKKGKKK